MLENARRRWPAVRFEVAYAAMQGTRAAAEVIEAVERLDRDPDVDVIVVARGGGSVEDLLPFSDEALVRAVHAVRTPVVSAIGHEPDTPLLDLVADVRASTPTDAAKLVVPDVAEELRRVAPARDRLRAAVDRLRRPRAGRPRRAALAGPSLADPRTAGRRPGRRGRPAARPGPPHACGTPSTGPPTTSATSAPGPGRCRRWRRCSAGYAVLQDADGHVVSSVAGGRPTGAPVAVRVADGRIHATTTRTEPTPSPAEDDR